MELRPAKWGFQSQVALQKFRAAHVGCGSKADIVELAGNVRSSPNFRHRIPQSPRLIARIQGGLKGREEVGKSAD